MNKLKVITFNFLRYGDLWFVRARDAYQPHHTIYETQYHRDEIGARKEFVNWKNKKGFKLPFEIMG
jgi:hypothetical protein